MNLLNILHLAPVLGAIVKALEEAVTGGPIVVPVKGVHVGGDVWDGVTTWTKRAAKAPKA